MTKKIEANSTVQMHYTTRLQDGSVADSSLDDNKPGQFVMGEGHISPAFEEALLGMAVGDKKRVDLKTEDAFGMPDTKQVYMIPREKFAADQALEVGMIMAFDLPSGEETSGIIRQFDDGLVTVDFNHPLAGRDVTFDVEIVSIG
jgi:FKBP-type peptidyl-prolyl cis-trans isomerase SlpA